MENLLILLFILFTGLLTRMFSMFLHEMGHGIAALCLTRQKVEIFIGSYGEKSKSFKFSVGRLIIYIKPFALNGGLCYHDIVLSPFRNNLIILAGPLTNLIIGLFFFWTLIFYRTNPFVSFLNLIIFGLFMMDFIISIIPNGRKIILADGTVTYSDGEQLKRSWKHRKRPKGYWEGLSFYNKADYAKAAEVLYQVITRGYKDEEVYRYAFSAFTMSKNYKAANELLPDYFLYVKPNADEYCNIGLVKQNTGDPDASISNYNRSLELNPKNWIPYNNRGYSYILKEEYEKAILNFDMAIQLSPESAYPYCNRGLAYIKTGRLEEGLNDTLRSIQIDDKNSYAYRNLSIYYYEMKDYENSYRNFKRAFELEKDTPDINDYLLRLKTLIGKN